MTTVVGICNMALGELRADPIVALTDNNPRAEACSVFYDEDRKQVLRDHTWNFAIKRTGALTAESTGPTFEFSYYHLLPTDFLRIVGVYGEDLLETLTPEEYQIENGKIASDYETIYIKYIYDNEDTTMFDPLFVKTLSLKLANSIALQVTGNASLKDGMFQLYELALQKAKTVDGQERPPKVKRNSGMKTARLQRKYRW